MIPVMKYRFRVEVEYIDMRCNTLSLNVERCHVDLLKKEFHLFVRHSGEPEQLEFSRNMVSGTPDFVLTMLDPSSQPLYSMVFNRCKFSRYDMDFDYNKVEPVMHNIVVGYEKLLTRKPEPKEEKSPT